MACISITHLTRRIFSIILLMGFGACTSGIANPSNLAPPSLCQSGEEILFSCQLDNSKTVSFCASKETLSPYIEYRFGTSNRIELKYRSTEAKDKNQIFLDKSEDFYQGKPRYTIFFKNRSYGYFLFLPNEFGTPSLYVNRANSNDLDSSNEFRCNKAAPVIFQPLDHPALATADQFQLRAWMNIFKKPNSYNINP